MLTQYQHPVSSQPISGMRLAQGAVLRPTDMYDSSSGKWERCPVPGLIVGKTDTVWMRPSDLLQKEKNLLKSLATRRSQCIAHKPSDARRYVVIPSSQYNWDTRIETATVTHPECIQTLVDVGFLRSDDWSRDDGVEIFHLTDAGYEFAQQ